MRVLLIGHPVGHSLSPVMQNAAFNALGLPHAYIAADTPASGLAGVLRKLRDGDHLGANVTVPYKVAVVSAMDAVDADVQTLGALNTIVATGDRLSGYNTDVDGAWAGLLEPVRESLRGAAVVVLGAGGAARALLMAMTRCEDRGPAEISVLARRPQAAEEVASLGVDLGLPARALEWAHLADAVDLARVVVNCTPVGLDGGDPLAGISIEGRVILDMTYARGGTALFRRAWSEAAVALQGDAMLLHQGAAAFELWTGRDAPLEVMRQALAAALG